MINILKFISNLWFYIKKSNFKFQNTINRKQKLTTCKIREVGRLSLVSALPARVAFNLLWARYRLAHSYGRPEYIFPLWLYISRLNFEFGSVNFLAFDSCSEICLGFLWTVCKLFGLCVFLCDYIFGSVDLALGWSPLPVPPTYPYPTVFFFCFLFVCVLLLFVFTY